MRALRQLITPTLVCLMTGLAACSTSGLPAEKQQPAAVDHQALRYQRAALAYERGEYQAALEALYPLADAGEPKAQTAVAMLYQEGKGVAQSYPKAEQWYRQAAAQGYADAQYGLGYLLYTINGKRPQRQEAVQWMTKAANQGHPTAQQFLRQIRSK